MLSSVILGMRAHPQAGGHGAGHHLFRVHLLDDVGGEPEPAEDVVHPVPGPAVVGIGDHGLPDQILELHAPAQGQGVAAGDHGHDLLVKNVKVFQLVAVHPGAEPQVDGPVGEGVDDLCRLLFTELELDGPVVLVLIKALDHIGDEAVAHGVGQGDADLAHVGVEHVFQLLVGQLQLRGDPVHMDQKLLPIFRDVDVPPHLEEERDAQLALQIPDGMTQAGLGDQELLCGFGIVFQPADGLKIIQLLKIHVSGPSPEVGSNFV